MRFAYVLCVLFAACGLDLKEVAKTPDAADGGTASGLAFLSNATKDGIGTAESVRALTQVYATLESDVQAGATKLPIQLAEATKAFQAGDLVLAHRSAVAGKPPVGLLELQPGSFEDVGRYIVLVVKGANDRELEVSTWDGKALPFALVKFGTQIVRIAQFAEVNIASGSTVSPIPWNGTFGGIVAFTSKGTITIDGSVDASGTGYEGARPDGTNMVTPTCEAAEGDMTDGHAPRGEGPFTAVYDRTVVNNVLTGIAAQSLGGGGGRCHGSGGGGGGHGGTGGTGGNNTDNSAGAEGGQKANYAVVPQDFASGFMLFGGGGGSGEVTTMASNTDDGSGGAGGGIVFIRGASKVLGGGTILSKGLDGRPSPASGGGGGGGAGGTVDVWIAGSLQTNASVRGGNGGNSPENHGPGGGGGGGRMFLLSNGSSLEHDVAGGTAGAANGERKQKSGEASAPVIDPNQALK